MRKLEFLEKQRMGEEGPVQGLSICFTSNFFFPPFLIFTQNIAKKEIVIAGN